MAQFYRSVSYSPDVTISPTPSVSPRLMNFANQRGYPIIVEKGQRKYGPPYNWIGQAPGRGTEVFVGKIPRTLMEDELIPIFERCGPIYQFRFMLDFSGTNRGYCFVKYSSKASADLACRELNDYEIRPGNRMAVVPSVDNCRLYFGNIPKNVSKEFLTNEIVNVTEGVVDVILYPHPEDMRKNRGFAFVEYESHTAAAQARRKLIPSQFAVQGVPIDIDWAEPEPQPDEEIMSKVKVLYVRNFKVGTTEKNLQQFAESITGHGSVERVKIMHHFAFIHFSTRAQALFALEHMNRQELDGADLEVAWAKPPIQKKSPAGRRSHIEGGLHSPVETLYGNVVGSPFRTNYPFVFPAFDFYGRSPTIQRFDNAELWRRFSFTSSR